MSEGIRPYDFVQQVYYAQEKVILDFWPDDDKYKEVLFEANLILQELHTWERVDFDDRRIDIEALSEMVAIAFTSTQNVRIAVMHFHEMSYF